MTALDGRRDGEAAFTAAVSGRTTELTSAHRPVLFRPGRPGDLEELAALLRDQPDLQVVDTMADQLRELRTIRDLGTPRGAALPGQGARELAGSSLGDQGVWVLFPWRRQVVHLLDETEFAQVRSSRNRNKITTAEQRRLRSRRVGVVGLSVGASVAVTIAMEGSCGQLRLADFDDLELSNLNRVRAGVADIGTPKVTLAARAIAEIDPFLDVRCFDRGVTEVDIDAFLTTDGALDLVVEECDSLDVKLLVRERARSHGIPVLMVTSEGGLVDVERFDRQTERPILHGLADGLTPEALRGMTAEEKVPVALRILGSSSLSGRTAASLVEVGETLSTWPQLASEVTLGGAVAADTWRRIALGEFHASGRFTVDPATVLVDSPEADDPNGGPGRAGPLQPELVRDLVDAATRAPSGGNSQPWRWVLRGDRLLLMVDQSRAGSGLDQGLAALVALGAAVENAVLTAHARGVDVVVEVLPAAEPGVVAVLRPADPGADEARRETHAHDDLAPCIALRRTNRGLGTPAPLADTALTAIDEAVRSVPGARLDCLLGRDHLDRAADVLARGERLRMLHPRLHAEMVGEVRWTAEEAARSGDGIDVRTLALSEARRALLELLRRPDVMAHLRAWDAGGRLGEATRDSVRAASVLALVTMPGRAHRDFFLGGRAVQRAWLTATRHGVAVQPLSSLPYLLEHTAGARRAPSLVDQMTAPMRTELEAVRRDFHELFEQPPSRAHVLLVRLFPDMTPPPPERRRPVADVLRSS